MPFYIRNSFLLLILFSLLFIIYLIYFRRDIITI